MKYLLLVTLVLATTVVHQVYAQATPGQLSTKIGYLNVIVQKCETSTETDTCDKIFNAINNSIDQLEKQEKDDIVKAHAMPSSGLDTG
jgi:Skp family chaperone for outer membrane proteins